MILLNFSHPLTDVQLEAVRALDDILRRMQSHQSKKRSMLRHLRLADQFAGPSQRPHTFGKPRGV